MYYKFNLIFLVLDDFNYTSTPEIFASRRQSDLLSVFTGPFQFPNPSSAVI